MKKKLVIYTMKECPWCKIFKDKLKEEKISFFNRDIEKHKDEYELFVQITNNDLVPSFMIVNETDESASLFAPDRDYNDISDAIEIIKSNL